MVSVPCLLDGDASSRAVIVDVTLLEAQRIELRHLFRGTGSSLAEVALLWWQTTTLKFRFRLALQNKLA